MPGPPTRHGEWELDAEAGAQEGADEELQVVGHTHAQACQIKVIKLRNKHFYYQFSPWPWLFDAGRLGKVIFLKPELISEKFVTVTLQKLQFLLLIFQRKFYCFSCS